MQSNSTNSNENGLSKSQKKRIKQKAARLRREAQDAPATVLRPAKKGSLNSNANLREDLNKMGYSYSEIDRTMEEMWNLQLQYDELETVLAFIRSRSSEADATNRMPDEGTSMPSTSANQINPGESDLQSRNGIVPVSSSHLVKPAVEAVGADNERGLGSKSISRKIEVEEKAPMTLKERLSTVANHDNLTDAIVALTEWITKAASPTQIEEICSASSNNALRTVIERSILDHSSDNAILLDLISSILKSSGLPPTGVSTAATQLAKLLNQARMSTKDADAATSANFATNIAFAIVKTISKQVKELQYSTQSGDSKIQQLEKEIERLASTMVVNGSNKPKVVELMTKRDTHKAAAEKYSTIMNITMLNVFIESGQDPEKISCSTLDNVQQRENLVASIIGLDSKAAESNRAKYNSLKSQLAEANSSIYNQRNSLSTELDACEKQRQAFSERIQLLKLEIQKLEQEDVKIKCRMDDLGAQMSTLLGTQSSDIRDLENELTEATKIIKLEDNTKAMVDMLHKFQTDLVSASTSTCSNTIDFSDFNPVKISRKIGIYIVRMMNYFSSEAEMVVFLNNRITSLESQISSLQFEIDQCESLEMTTNVTHKIKALNETRQHVLDDKELIDTLQREAETMRDELMKVLNDFKQSLGSNGDNSGLTAIHTSMLKGIKDSMLRIGLNDDGGLTTYFESITPTKSTKNGRNGKLTQKKQTPSKLEDKPTKATRAMKATKVTKATNGKASKGGKVVVPDPISAKASSSDSSTATTSTSSSTPIPAPIPKTKISWAVSTNSQKGATKSLLDIQKEELSMKDVN